MSAVAPTVQQQQVDAVYRSQRLRLSAVIAAEVAAAWARSHTDRQATLKQVIALVTVGQAHTVRLVDAYMAAKAREATGVGSLKHLNPANYTIEALRGISADIVYGRPFGAYGAFRNEGADAARAIEAAQASVTKLARTDMQLAQTNSARDWMSQDENVYGWRRVLNGPTNCPLCVAAATRIYYRDDLAPIHENCDCSVEPLFGKHPGGLSIPADAVRVVEDPELGLRLLADNWAA